MPADDYVTFQFDKIDSLYYLEPHEFYVSQAQHRFFSQFTDEEMGKVADDVREKYLQRPGSPDMDTGDYYESSYDVGVQHWIALNDMRKTVSLSLTAGMFHQFDKGLREKVIREFSFWQDPVIYTSLVWDTSFPSLISLLEWTGIPVSTQPFYTTLNVCRQVVNVYKHGDGHSHQFLSAHFPQYYRWYNHPYLGGVAPRHEDLEITQEQFVEFAEAISAFWKYLITTKYWSDAGTEPSWLAGEIKKHAKKIKAAPGHPLVRRRRRIKL